MKRLPIILLAVIHALSSSAVADEGSKRSVALPLEESNALTAPASEAKGTLIPEPGIFALIGTAGLILLFRRRSR